MPKLPVEEIITAARAGTRSPLYEYLFREYDSLLPELSKTPVNWSAVAEKFRSAGIMAGRDKEVTEQIVRQTWWRVRADKTGRVKTKKPNLKDQWKG